MGLAEELGVRSLLTFCPSPLYPLQPADSDFAVTQKSESLRP